MPTALIADDEDLPRAELRRMLAAAWPELRVVAECEHGPAAVEAIDQWAPDIAFLDIRMPGLSGLDVARAASGRCHPYSPPPTTATPSPPSTPAPWTTCSSPSPPTAWRRPWPGCANACPGRRRRSDAGAGRPALEQLRAPARRSTGAPRQQRPRLRGDPGAVSVPPCTWCRWTRSSTSKPPTSTCACITAEREHLIRTLAARAAAAARRRSSFWQVHRGTVVQARCIASARRDESGKAFLSLKGRAETLTVSRLYAHLFKGM